MRGIWVDYHQCGLKSARGICWGTSPYHPIGGSEPPYKRPHYSTQPPTTPLMSHYPAASTQTQQPLATMAQQQAVPATQPQLAAPPYSQQHLQQVMELTARNLQQNHQQRMNMGRVLPLQPGIPSMSGLVTAAAALSAAPITMPPSSGPRNWAAPTAPTRGGAVEVLGWLQA